MTKREYLHPLHDFISNIDEFEITDRIRIVSKPYVNLDKYLIKNSFLTSNQVYNIANCSHFLIMDWENNKSANKEELSEYLNIFQMVLNFKQPNSIRVINRLWETKSIDIFYDNFGYYNPLSGKLCNRFDNEDLAVVKELFVRTQQLLRDSNGIYSAFRFCYIAMTIIHWDVAYVNYIASLEVLFCNRLKGETTGSSILMSICAIFAGSKMEYDKYILLYKDVYKVRNKILHGSYNPNSSSNDNLKKLLLLEEMIRKLWLEIINNNELQEKLGKPINIKTRWLNGLISQFDTVGQKDNK